MNTDADTIIDWNRVEHDAAAEQKEGFFVTRILPDSNLNIFAGLERPSNRRYFYILLSDKKLVPKIKSTRGLEIFSRSEKGEDNGRIEYGIILRDSSFDDIFKVFVGDVVRRLQKITSDQSAVKLINDMISKWQYFLSRRSDILSPEEYEGLWGELKYLSSVLIPVLGNQSVFAWKGPSRYPQDFCFTGLRVEVKTALSGKHDTVRISNEHQLELSSDSVLFLALLTAEEKSSGESLKSLIEKMRSVFIPDPECLEYFDNQLIEAGCWESHMDYYNSPSFILGGIRHYFVNKDFPRIESVSLKKGIEKVSYSLRINDLKNYITAPGQIEKYLSRNKEAVK